MTSQDNERLGAPLRAWWEETDDLRRLGLGLTFALLSAPGIVHKLLADYSVLSIFTAVSTELPLTAAAVIIFYRHYRNLSLSVYGAVVICVAAAGATAVFGIGGGGEVREAFLHITRAPGTCFTLQGHRSCFPGAIQMSQPAGFFDVVLRLGKLYWHLWGASGIVSALLVGWFLGKFWARQVVGAVLRAAAA